MGRFWQPQSEKFSFVLLTVLMSVVLFFFLLFPANLFAKSVNPVQAEKAVKGWLKSDSRPFGMDLEGKIKKVEVFKDADGVAIYYIIYLDSRWFVVVSADDCVEPVVGFVNGDRYDPSDDNPLGSLVSRDLAGRVTEARNLEAGLISGGKGRELSGKDAIIYEESIKAKGKWKKFQDDADLILVMGLSSVSDVRVAPLVQSKWSQTTACGSTCYNYYTPNDYPCGCVATAMAQLIRYHQYPTAGIGVNSFTIYVDDVPQTAYTRGGDGSGGAYNWSDMVLVPDCGLTTAQREAIGALCYDAGVSVSMSYYSDGSGAYTDETGYALVNTFGYSNGIAGYNSDNNIGAGLNGMINPNLDACSPVLLGIAYGDSGHAIVADGYGYNSSTLYHHLNMGWGGSDDAWYNLPNIDSSPPFNSVYTCIYNVYTSGTGEIISGRVVNESGAAMSGATVTASGTGGPYTAVTNSNGIYALAKVMSSTAYTVSVSKEGYSFDSQNVTSGDSYDYSNTSGNKWEINFQGVPATGGCNVTTIGSGTSTWDYPLHTFYHDSRTQVIYLAGEIGRSGPISALALNVTTIPGQDMNYWTIRMKHTTMSSYSPASFDSSGWTAVYQATGPRGAAGWRTFNFSTPFEYNGTDNLLIDFSHNNTTYTSSGNCTYSTPGGTRSAYAYSDSAYGDPLNWSGTSSPTVYGSTKVPNIRLTICADPNADIDGDGNVDMFDYAVLAGQWQQAPGVPSADISPPGGDGIVDFEDLAIMAEQWLNGV